MLLQTAGNPPKRVLERMADGLHRLVADSWTSLAARWPTIPGT
ncbi:hypothetical protein ACPESV_11505 [Streptomyces umbrinus]